jgi:PAS domain S-box-containing protein
MKTEIEILRRQIEDLKADNLRLLQSENEAVYRSLFENSHAVMLLIDPETAAIRDANTAACAYYGWSREELKALSIEDINTLTRDEILTQMRWHKLRSAENPIFKHR